MPLTTDSSCGELVWLGKWVTCRSITLCDGMCEMTVRRDVSGGVSSGGTCLATLHSMHVSRMDARCRTAGTATIQPSGRLANRPRNEFACPSSHQRLCSLWVRGHGGLVMMPSTCTLLFETGAAGDSLRSNQNGCVQRLAVAQQKQRTRLDSSKRQVRARVRGGEFAASAEPVVIANNSPQTPR